MFLLFIPGTLHIFLWQYTYGSQAYLYADMPIAGTTIISIKSFNDFFWQL
jgi:hypothetical protein